jgi:hypothetical protein
MAYISNSGGIVIDAILTKRGRMLLAQGNGQFQISQYALSDSEVDYSLYNPDHPLGTSFADIVITSMPITEAVPDETQNMKSFLVTLPRKTVRIPIVSVPQTSYTLSTGQSVTINPQTINYTDGNSTLGYTFILADSDVCSAYISETAPGQIYQGQGSAVPSPLTESEQGQAITLVGKAITLTANMLSLAARSTTLTIIGNETGGRVVVNLTVKKVTLNTTPNVPLQGNPPVKIT